MHIEEVCEGEFCLLDVRFMNLGVDLGQNFELNQAECFLIGENGSRGRECFYASRRARCVQHPEFIPVAVEVFPPSFPKDWPALGGSVSTEVSRFHA